jgi:uncharacterized protein (TIGR02145 family)
MKRIVFLGTMVVLLLMASCKKESPIRLGTGLGGDGTFTHDGIIYAYKIIGTQTWMIDNLAWLPSVSPSSNGSDSSPFYYVMDYEGSSVSAAKATDGYKTYGVLYNWEAAKTACPPGWHLPTDEEWKILEVLCGMDESEANESGYRSGYVGQYLKSTTSWADGGNGTNDAKFNALPGGYRDQSGFAGPGYVAYFWTSTESGSSKAWQRQLQSFNNDVWRGDDFNRKAGMSVRCVKDQ